MRTVKAEREARMTIKTGMHVGVHFRSHKEEKFC